jgi:hypothetical protein
MATADDRAMNRSAGSGFHGRFILRAMRRPSDAVSPG